MSTPSPYKPHNPTPPFLAGRDPGLRWFHDDLLQIREQGHTNTPAHAVVGPQRMGKSALLHSFAQAAEKAGFAVIRALARPGEDVTSRVSQEIAPTGPEARPRVAAITGGALTFNGSLWLDLPPRREFGSDIELRRQLAKETAKVGRKRPGVVILVDAAHDADPASFLGLTDAVQRNQASTEKHGAEILLVVAGDQRLEPQLVGAGAAAPFKWHSLGLLSEQSTMQAFAEPAYRAGVTWDPQALRRATDLTRGYPQWIQAYGEAIWRNSRDGLITMDAVHRGTQSLNADLLRDVEQVWHRADSLDRDVMASVARVGGRRHVTELADDLELSVPDARSLVHRSLRNEALHPLGQDSVTLPRPHMGRWILGTQQPQAQVGEQVRSVAEFREARAAVTASRRGTTPTISPATDPRQPPPPAPGQPDPHPYGP